MGKESSTLLGILAGTAIGAIFRNFVCTRQGF